MAELTKKSPYKLETIDGPRTLWEYNFPVPDGAGGTKTEEVLLCFRALREEDAKTVENLGIGLLGRGYFKADMLCVHESGFKVLKRVWVTDDPIEG